MKSSESAKTQRTLASRNWACVVCCALFGPSTELWRPLLHRWLIFTEKGALQGQPFDARLHSTVLDPKQECKKKIHARNKITNKTRTFFAVWTFAVFFACVLLACLKEVPNVMVIVLARASTFVISVPVVLITVEPVW